MDLINFAGQSQIEIYNNLTYQTITYQTVTYQTVTYHLVTSDLPVNFVLWMLHFYLARL